MLYSLMSEPPGRGSWEEDALCREYDSSLWLLSEDRQLNKDNFEKAEIVCSKCPVFEECWQSSTETDRSVTMRAGAWPTDYVDPDVNNSVCSNGHDVSAPGSRNKRGRCLACRRATEKRYRDRVTARKKGVD